MRTRRIGIALAVGVAAVAVPALVSAASNAYTSPALRVTQAGVRTSITASVSQTDDGTAQVSIYIPAGTSMSTTALPGAPVGNVQATIAAHTLGGAVIPLTGQIVVAPAGAVTPAQIAACTGGASPTTIWFMSLSAAGQTLNVPMYLVPTAGADAALGVAKIVACFTAHDLPGTPPPCAPFLCAQFLSASLLFDAVFTPPATGTWISLWTPYQRGNGQVNPAGTVASPSTTAPGAITVTARRRGVLATATGRVTQAGRPVAGATVTVRYGRTAGRLTRTTRVRTNASGSYRATADANAGAYFRASTTMPARTSASVCAALSALPVPCVNGTISGFAATTRVVRAR